MKKTIILLMSMLLWLTACSNSDTNASEKEIKDAYVDAYVNTIKEDNMHYKVYIENVNIYGKVKDTATTIYEIIIVKDENGKQRYLINMILQFDGHTIPLEFYHDGDKYYMTFDGLTDEVDTEEAGADLDILNLANMLIFETDELINPKMTTEAKNTRISFELDKSIMTTALINELDFDVQLFIADNTKYDKIESSILIDENNEIIQTVFYLSFPASGSDDITINYQYVVEVVDKGDSVVLDYEIKN